ncbi:MAG: DUF2570 family protein [[Actinobacillus] rossii]|uniref:Protein of uncharacterized function (DUF2570) n=1 Tax=[Actinobacillus] rossii TaxID=123820 RepID=A0A380TYE3_9PAST|nr:DUF2570 family protein [[Actinobacillus] rossii]SUT93684.1 Protein of uncharacterised function (DUF2570) [[Actinobacillus] rossii]
MGIGDSLTKLFWLCVVCMLVVVFGLCGWIYYQSNKIDSLNMEIEIHKQTITTQSSTIKQLKADVEYNKQLTLELSKVESEARSKSDEVIKSIPKQTKASSAFNADAPSNVIEFLRQ